MSNSILYHFHYHHLPPHLQAISSQFHAIAAGMNSALPDSAEKTAGLRKLLEAKDCMVRAAVENAEYLERTITQPKKENKMSGIEFGDQARDTVTGFVGVVTALAKYATGCDQYLLSPEIGEKGEYREGHWFDVERVAIINKAHKTIASSPTGGPRAGADGPPVK